MLILYSHKFGNSNFMPDDYGDENENSDLNNICYDSMEFLLALHLNYIVEKYLEGILF
jgi:hypothetical protein